MAQICRRSDLSWIFPGVTNEVWQQLISYQINDRQAFQLLHSPHSLSTSGPSLMFLTGMREMICMLHSDWDHYFNIHWNGFNTNTTNRIKCFLAANHYFSALPNRLKVPPIYCGSMRHISRHFAWILFRAGWLIVNTESIPIIFSSEPGQMGLLGRRGAPHQTRPGDKYLKFFVGKEIKQT